MLKEIHICAHLLSHDCTIYYSNVKVGAGTPDYTVPLCHDVSKLCKVNAHTHHVGCTSANQARLDLDLPSCVPGGSELGGDNMCSVCMDHVS